MPYHAYKVVKNVEDGIVDESIPLEDGNLSPSGSRASFSAPPNETKSRAKPSVHRLLPYFFLTSLAFGLTMVPRVSVLKSSICRELVDFEMSAAAMSSRRHGGGGGGGMSMSSMSSNDTMGHLAMGSYDSRCSSADVTASVAFMSTYRDLITGIIGAIMSFYLGKLSDRVGRVKIMAFNGIGILVSELIMVLVVALPDYLNYRWLFLSFAIDGLSGSFPLLMATASSYVVDSTSEKDRVVAMGWIQSGMFFGMAVGPAAGSALSRLSGTDRPSAIFFYSLLCRIFALGFLIVLPESLPDIERYRKVAEPRFRPSSWITPLFESMPTYESLKLLVSQERSSDELRQTSKNLFLLMGINSIMFGTSVGAMDVMMLYPQASFNWDMMETGNFISIVNGFRTFSTVVILRLTVYLLNKFTSAKPYRQDESHLPLIRIALCFDILGYLGFALAPTSFWFVAAGILSSISALGMATSQASMSLMVSVEHIGKLMGILGSLQALTRLVSPPIINLVYAWTVSFLPQMVFFGLAVVLSIVVMITYLLRAH